MHVNSGTFLAIKCKDDYNNFANVIQIIFVCNIFVISVIYLCSGIREKILKFNKNRRYEQFIFQSLYTERTEVFSFIETGLGSSDYRI